MTAALVTPHTDTTIRTIKRNAGKIPGRTIALALCWGERRLARVAEQHRIDLTYPRRESRAG